MKKRNTFAIVFITFLVTSAMYLGAYILAPSLFEFFDSLGGGGFVSSKDDLYRVKNLIEKNYYEDADSQFLTDSAIKGYVGALGDVYSEYYTKAEYLSFSEDMSGSYKGIGVEISNTDNKIRVEAVYPNSPAQKALIEPGDFIERINGVSFTGEDLSKATNAIRTAKEDPVVLTISRDGKTMDVEVVRSNVDIPVVESELLEGDIGYIRLYQFTEDSNESFRTHLNTVVSNGAKALIIDLRDNPGGLLTSVVDIADLLLPEGNILTIKGKGMENQEFSSGKTCVELPMYILINENSASGSEVLAGALKDHKKAVLIGKTTYGKGLVQSIYELDSGAALKLTTARYYTPSGVCINGTGIEPHHEVNWAVDDDYVYDKSTDIQLQKAIELIEEKVE